MIVLCAGDGGLLLLHPDPTPGHRREGEETSLYQNPPDRGVHPDEGDWLLPLRTRGTAEK